MSLLMIYGIAERMSGIGNDADGIHVQKPSITTHGLKSHGEIDVHLDDPRPANGYGNPIRPGIIPPGIVS